MRRWCVTLLRAERMLPIGVAVEIASQASALESARTFFNSACASAS